MNTVARFWLLLTAFYSAAHALLFVLGWHTIDLRFEVIVQHAVIPFLQAAGLAWVMGAYSLKIIALAIRQAVSRPLVFALWCTEGAFLFVYWVPQTGTDLTEIVARTAGIVALLGVVILLIGVLPAAAFRTSIAILPFAILILALGLNGIKPWFNVLPLWLPENWPFLLRQMLVLIGTVLSVIVLTGQAQKRVSARNPLAGLILSLLLPFFIVAAMALVLNGYLYSFLASPWLRIIVTSLSLGATCLLAAALCLFRMPNSDEESTFCLLQKPLRPVSLLGAWFVLALCGLFCVIILHVLLFPQWDWSAPTLLSLLLIPLMQASWLRWAQELHKGWRFLIPLFRHQFIFFVLICFEIAIFGYVAFSRDLWNIPSFIVIVSAWVGFKLVILGAVILKGAFQDTSSSKFRGICGAVTLIWGMGSALTGGYSTWIWMPPVFGSAFVLMGLWWRRGASVDGASLAGATAEAVVIPLLSISFCILITQVQPMEFVIQGGYAAAALATTFLWMYLSALIRGSKSIQKIR